MKSLSSIALLFGLITGTAIYIGLVQAALRGNSSATAAAVIIMPVILYGLLSAILYALLAPMGRFNNYIDHRIDPKTSPFAADQLPTQLVPPTESNVAN